MAGSCTHCKKPVGFWRGLVGGTLCAQCRPSVVRARRQWGAALDTCLADRILTMDEERSLDRLARQLALTPDDLAPFTARIVRARQISASLLGHPSAVPTNVNLKPNETCWFRTPATLYEERTIRKYVGGSRGVSIRIMKGVSYRVGSSRGYSVPVSEVVPVCTGDFYITSQRCLFIGPRKTVSVAHKDLLSFDAFDDGMQLHHDQSSKLQVFKFSDGELGAAVLSGVLSPMPMPPSAQIASPSPGTAATMPGAATAIPPAYIASGGAGGGLPSASASVKLRVLQVVCVASLVLLAPLGIALVWWKKIWNVRVRVVASLASAAFFAYVLAAAPHEKKAKADAAAESKPVPPAPQLSTPSVSTIDFGKPDVRSLSQSELKYFAAAREFLESVNESDATVAGALERIRANSSNLDELKRAIEAARKLQDSAYAEKLGDTGPPQAFGPSHKKIQRCKFAHDAAFEEALRYWTDSDGKHLQQGTAQLGDAIAATISAATELKAASVTIGVRRRSATSKRPPTQAGSGSGNSDQTASGGTSPVPAASISGAGDADDLQHP